MPRHIRRLIIILVLALCAGVSARYYFIDPSFGLLGHYRFANSNAADEVDQAFFCPNCAIAANVRPMSKSARPGQPSAHRTALFW